MKLMQHETSGQSGVKLLDEVVKVVVVLDRVLVVVRIVVVGNAVVFVVVVGVVVVLAVVVAETVNFKGITSKTSPNLLRRAQNSKFIPSLNEFDTNARKACLFRTIQFNCKS